MTTVRHFRQIVLWPLQLMPLRPGAHVQRHWEALEGLGHENRWREVRDEFDVDPQEFRERHYKEFVTFLPYVQRFMHGATVGQETSSRHGEPSMRVFRREDVSGVRVLYDGDMSETFHVADVDLYFFLDADVAILVVELYADDIPLDRAQDTLFRFGRAYPAWWTASGDGGNCPKRVEWLGAGGSVLATSDYERKGEYLAHVAKYRAPRLAAHWQFLLKPLGLEHPGQIAALRYRQLEYYRMPLMAYLALDEPNELTRADFVRLALVTRPGPRDALPYSERSLASFESDYCEERFWGREGENFSGDARLISTGLLLAAVGRHGDTFFDGRETGMFGQFRHQYFLLFLIAHFHRAALLSMSDELAVAMNRLEVGDTESVREFKRTIRRSMEIFLRFTHRYWFHEVSSQELARTMFTRLSRHLRNDELYHEVRTEVADMNSYLDTDSMRRQANTILRLTVVTVVGLIGTVATGFLGMNLLAAADEPFLYRILLFLLILVLTGGVTLYSVVKSKPLAAFLDALSDERVSWRDKWQALTRARKN
ncbi:MAG TPA: CorA family divalent cation transporter [Gammaproteobacteria bacterium]|nr:CorA family divalent cation transporter [Gammaproteobacteria bacterium]